MEQVLLAILLKPLVLLLLAAVVLVPVRIATRRMRDGKLKRFLLR